MILVIDDSVGGEWTVIENKISYYDVVRNVCSKGT